MAPVAAGLLPQSPVAVSSDGSLLALVRRDGLFLLPLEGGVEKQLSAEIPSALAFNPDGTELAAAFAAADGGRLRRYAPGSGEVLAEIAFPGRCEALLSREGEWLAFLTTLQSFRFGGNLRSRLLRWDGVNPPGESLLNDMTLDRSTLAERGSLLSTLRPQLSPYGDEILFLRLHDPPAFDPYLAVVLHHIETGSDRLVVKLPQLRGAATYLGGGELIAYGDGIDLVKIVDPWKENEKERLLRPGQQLAASPSGEILWVDDILLRRDGQVLVSFAKEAEPVSFLGGGRLLLRDKERLWLLSGLAVSSPEPLVEMAQRRLLRKWRAEGLIDGRDYVERIGK